jgi:RNA polymerase sigma-70 factor (ECF subfamily)
LANPQADDDDAWERLLTAAQGGDAMAYRAFLQAALPFARAITRRRAASPDMVEDIVQDALLTLHRVRHTYQPGRPVRPWLAAIVTRRAIDAGRRSGRIAGRERHDPAAYETFADEAANRNEKAARSAEEVEALMTGLTPKQREAVDLVKLKEMSLIEASAASGQTVAALKVNIHRALQRLRRGRNGEGRE